ncbi:MAG: hypothetical protein HY002_00285 [Candidatus Rokubacteria bacterium]|nr:hypothetical protein [Candidatus Rokubacteria bacterium]
MAKIASDLHAVAGLKGRRVAPRLRELEIELLRADEEGRVGRAALVAGGTILAVFLKELFFPRFFEGWPISLDHGAQGRTPRARLTS